MVQGRGSLPQLRQSSGTAAPPVHGRSFPSSSTVSPRLDDLAPHTLRALIPRTALIGINGWGAPIHGYYLLRRRSLFNGYDCKVSGKDKEAHSAEQKNEGKDERHALVEQSMSSRYVFPWQLRRLRRYRSSEACGHCRRDTLFDATLLIAALCDCVGGGHVHRCKRCAMILRHFEGFAPL